MKQPAGGARGPQPIDEGKTSPVSVDQLLARFDEAGLRLRVRDGRLHATLPLMGPVLDDLHTLRSRRGELTEAMTDYEHSGRLVLHRTGDDTDAPLAVPQERLWFLQQLDPDSVAYNIVATLRVTGALDPAAAVSASDALIRRHDALRTVFPTVGGRPVQRVTEGCATAEVVDAATMPDAERLVAEVGGKAFDLTSGPLVRLRIIRISAELHLVAFVAHHLVADQWTLGLLGLEFAAIYEARRTGIPEALAPLPFRYRDFAVCHRAWLTGQVARTQLSYWRRQLSGLVPTELPGRPGARPGRADGGHLALPPVLLAGLRAVGGTERASLFMVLLSALYVLLARYTGKRDLAVGTPVAGRTEPSVQGLVGTFVNTLVLRTETSDVGSFRALLRRVRAMSLDAFRHQDLSFDRLVSELRPARLAGRTPFFQVLFNVQNAPFDVPRMAGCHVDVWPLPPQATQFDLSLSVDTEIAHRLSYTFDAGMFEASFVHGFLRHYLNVLEAVVSDPDQPIETIRLFDERDDRQLARWNATAEPAFLQETVPSLFAAQVAARRNHIAVVDGNGALSYGELDARASRLASELAARGVGPETLVGVFIDRSADAVVALLGILKAGGAYVPLDPAFPGERLLFMLNDSRARLVVTSSALRDRVPGALPVHLVDAPEVTSVGATPVPPTAGAQQLAYVLYTSGSTGRPKGVAIENRSLTSFLLSMQREPGFSSEDRLLSVTTLSFDIAALEIFLPIVAGGTVVLASSADARDPKALAALIDQHQITVMQATPATWRMLLDSGWKGHAGLRVLCGGEAMTRDLADRLLDAAGVVWNMYGPTETTIWSTVQRVERGPEPIAVGRPIANTSVFILDDQLRRLPDGAIGELVIGGAGVARGYLGRPELTDERFLVLTLSGGQPERVYRTGDLARRWPDGRIECLGRADRQVKVRGYRIELGEVEGALEQVPDVAGAAVIAVPDASGEAQLVGFIVWAPGAEDRDPATVRAVAARSLPPYMVPSRLISLDRFPLTPNGKVDRAKLVVPDNVLMFRWTVTEPSSDLERTLATIWAEVLGVGAVGVEDDFFEIGGHSLLAVQVMARIKEQCNRSLPLAALFEARTVRALAHLLETDRVPSPWVSLIPIQREGSRPPFFCVHGVGGEVLMYADLAEALPRKQPFVAIRAPFYDGTSQVLPTIEDQAEFYVREVVAYQPVGPYYLGGYSHGGRVALEMAIRLEQRGSRVALLAILDTSPFYVPQPRFLYARRWLANLPNWLWHDVMQTSLPGNLDRVRRLWGVVRRQIGLESPRGNPADHSPTIAARDVMNLAGLPPQVQEVYEQDFRAFLQYRPSVPCGDVVVFRSKGQPVFGSHEPDLGWHRASRGRVTVRPVAGSHSSFLQKPAVAELARALQEELDRAHGG